MAQVHPKLASRPILSAMAHTGSSRSDLEALLWALGQAWCLGSELSLSKLMERERRQRVMLPSYPFERRHHLFATTAQGVLPAVAEAAPAPEYPSVVEPAVVEPAPAAVEPEKAAKDSLQDGLARIFEEVLGVSNLSAADNFFDLGGSSLLAVQIRSRITQQFGVTLPIHFLIEHPTLGELAQHVERSVSQSADSASTTRGETSPLLIPLHRKMDSRAKLFMVQPIGGTVYTYRELAEHLSSRLSVYGLRASGMEAGEPIYTSVPEIAARYVEALRVAQPKGPYLLGGHSSGGVIAYEIAQQLIKRGETVRAIFMLDSVSLEQSRRAAFASAEDVQRFFAPFQHLSPRAWQSVSAAFAQDSGFRAIILATNKAIASYMPEETPAPIVYLRAQERDAVLDHHPEQGWITLAGGGFMLCQVEGNHLNMMEEPHTQRVARVMLRSLRQLSARTGEFDALVAVR